MPCYSPFARPFFTRSLGLKPGPAFFRGNGCPAPGLPIILLLTCGAPIGISGVGTPGIILIPCCISDVNPGVVLGIGGLAERLRFPFPVGHSVTRSTLLDHLGLPVLD